MKLEGEQLEKEMKAEQMLMNLPPQSPASVMTDNEPPANVFRPHDKPGKNKDKIHRHKLWLETIQREYPMPTIPWRIGVYIRYFNQTKYEDYLDYHKKQFQDTIALCPLWTLVDFYVDNGSVAPNMESAKDWCRLLGDCFSGKVNLIITQKVSNVTRKYQDITLLSRILATQPNPVGIYFISENLFTLASYYRHDLQETSFLPEGLDPLPEEEHERLLSGESEESTDDE